MKSTHFNRLNYENSRPHAHRILICLMVAFSSLFLTAQNRQDYYVLAKPNYSLEPLQITINPDQTLTVDLSDNNLEGFLNSIPVYSIQKAFPTAYSPLLKRTYRITLEDASYLNDFFQRNEIELVELVEEENIELFIPNDFNYIDRGTPNTALDIIKAPFAWNLTHGSTGIFAGVLDNGFYLNHEDLINEIVMVLGNNPAAHGTGVSSVIGGQTDNNVGLSSIGFKTKLAVKSGGGHNGALLLSQQPGVRVINISLKFGCTFSVFAAEVFEEIWNGTPLHPPVVVVAAAGNGEVAKAANNGGYCPDTNGGANGYVYPAAYGNVIAVSGVNHLVPRGTEDFQYGFGVSWEDLAQRDISIPYSTLTYNDKVDLCAPAHHVMAANNDSDGYGFGYGTSYASPIVVGTVALMLNVNPNLTPNQVRDILKNTTDDIYFIPENGPYINLYGTGRLNAYRAVKTAQCMLNPTPGLDLAMQNSDVDDFVEPDTVTEILWQSDDIWVRNENDGREVRFHQNPKYDPSNPNYVYVRVTNNSCQTSTGNDNLKLYWAKANTTLYWPENWDGSLYIEDPVTGADILMGDEVGTLSIPVLGPGESKILEFQWPVPNPQDYININNGNPWHFCLLARIESLDDPMTYPEGIIITNNVKNNNNIVWKNTTVIDVMPDTPSEISAVVAVGNPYDNAHTFKLEFKKDDAEIGKAIYEEAEVSVALDNILYNAWQSGGQSTTHVETTYIPQRKIISDNNAGLNNILFNANEIGTLTVSFNFLAKELTNKTKYSFYVMLRDAVTNEIIGGETFVINKKPRSVFDADAGSDETIDRSESVTISATQINEAAVYNWYDPAGNLIFTGPDLTVSPNVTQRYRLEIITDTDGYKDYDDVEVTVNPYKLESLIPNPATSQVTVNYTADEASSAYLMVVSTVTGISNNYILDVNETSVNLNISAYTSGTYSVALVCDGQIVDSKNLAKQ
ncbi:Thermophilic serine proteinase [Aequorivita lipolytica]|nr:S8 family serine peptidase [Aequorivita lipolytica]SRX50851.1 Thermophilic serine proteinase [Aequorivita lipolytica]